MEDVYFKKPGFGDFCYPDHDSWVTIAPETPAIPGDDRQV